MTGELINDVNGIVPTHDNILLGLYERWCYSSSIPLYGSLMMRMMACAAVADANVSITNMSKVVRSRIRCRASGATTILLDATMK